MQINKRRRGASSVILSSEAVAESGFTLTANAVVERGFPLTANTAAATTASIAAAAATF